MAFVNELIPEEAKEAFDFPVQVSLTSGAKPTLWKWTVDRERNAFLIQTGIEGGAYEGTPEETSFVLLLDGHKCSFTGTNQIRVVDGANHLTWNIRNLSVSDALAHDQERVMSLIADALDAMGFLYRRSAVKTVTTHFDNSIRA